MAKVNIVKLIGTIASATLAGGAVVLPEQYRPLALAVAGLVVGWLHIPRPGDAKVQS